jgi:hypothetical protein
MHSEPRYLLGQVAPWGVEALERGHVAARDRSDDRINGHRPTLGTRRPEGDDATPCASRSNPTPHDVGCSQQIVRLEE